MLVTQVSVEDEHFISITGIDQFNQLRKFTGHHSATGITVEVVPEEKRKKLSQWAVK